MDSYGIMFGAMGILIGMFIAGYLLRIVIELEKISEIMDDMKRRM